MLFNSKNYFFLIIICIFKNLKLVFKQENENDNKFYLSTKNRFALCKLNNIKL